MIFDQTEFEIRCEWGERGMALLAPTSDVVIIVDVLSFSTAVEIATSRGATLFPYAWKDDTAEDFAVSVGAEVAGKGAHKKLSLSPSSLLDVPQGTKVVLPSPNGSTLSLLAGSTPLIAGCLRNARAVAEAASKMGRNVAVIPAGERWEDGTLRPCFEDLVGAGAIIRHLPGARSSEASAAVGAFERASGALFDSLKACGSGKEKIERGEEPDVRLAAELDVSRSVPLLRDQAFVTDA